MESKQNHKNFSITMNRGFQMMLPNGYIVSIQFGPVNYCDNRDFSTVTAVPTGVAYSCNNAETAVFHSVTDEWVRPPWDEGGDTVQGWQSPEDVVKLIAWAASLPDPTKERRHGSTEPL
jgi:hypothetical protein